MNTIDSYLKFKHYDGNRYKLDIYSGGQRVFWDSFAIKPLTLEFDKDYEIRKVKSKERKRTFATIKGKNEFSLSVYFPSLEEQYTAFCYNYYKIHKTRSGYPEPEYQHTNDIFLFKIWQGYIEIFLANAEPDNRWDLIKKFSQGYLDLELIWWRKQRRHFEPYKKESKKKFPLTSLWED